MTSWHSPAAAGPSRVSSCPSAIIRVMKPLKHDHYSASVPTSSVSLWSGTDSYCKYSDSLRGTRLVSGVLLLQVMVTRLQRLWTGRPWREADSDVTVMLSFKLG